MVAVVGAGQETATWDPDDRLDLSAYAPPVSGADGKPGLPLALGIGALLLDEAGYTGPRLVQAVDEAAPPPPACGWAATSRPWHRGWRCSRSATAARGAAPPRPATSTSGPSRSTTRCSRRCGTATWRRSPALDPDLARDLMVTGRAAWQVLAGALAGPGRATEISYAADPFGVAYLVATLDLPTGVNRCLVSSAAVRAR